MDKEFIYKVAVKLEEKCKQRHAHDFYRGLHESAPELLHMLHDKISGYINENLEFEKVEYDLGTMMRFVLDFYREFDEELCENIWSVLEDMTTICFVGKPDDKSGVNAVGVVEDFKRNKNGKIVCKPGIRKPPHIEVQLHPTNDVNGLIVVAHEMGHIMEERVQKKMKQKTDCLGEICSMFMENVFAEYLLQTKMIDMAQYETFLKKREQDFVGNVRTLLEEDEILRQLKVPITGEQLVLLEEKYKGTKRGEILKYRIGEMIDEEHPVHGEHCFRYVVGQILSQLIFEEYKQDKSNALKRFKQFISKNAEMDAGEAFSTLLGENYKRKIKNFLENGRKKE